VVPPAPQSKSEAIEWTCVEDGLVGNVSLSGMATAAMLVGDDFESEKGLPTPATAFVGELAAVYDHSEVGELDEVQPELVGEESGVFSFE